MDIITLIIVFVVVAAVLVLLGFYYRYKYRKYLGDVSWPGRQSLKAGSFLMAVGYLSMLFANLVGDVMSKTLIIIATIALAVGGSQLSSGVDELRKIFAVKENLK